MFAKFTDFIIKLLFPPRCMNCREINEKYDSLCRKCWKSIKFITKPYCKICGYPFEYSSCNKQIECYNCHNSKKTDKQVIYRSLMQYNECSKQLIFKLKYQDKLELGKFIGKMINNNYKEILKEVDIICPVPIHKLKMLTRKYNQSAVIINNVRIAKDKKILDLLVKIKNTHNQTDLKYYQRSKNLKNSIKVNENYLSALQNKKILIIDDVITTGATLKSCSDKLIDAGAKKIYCITAIRVCKKIKL